MTEKLYERDLQLWIEQTIQHLQNREFEALDVENLIEELTDLGQSGSQSSPLAGQGRPDHRLVSETTL